MGAWSSGMIPVLGTGGLGFDSRSAPIILNIKLLYFQNKNMDEIFRKIVNNFINFFKDDIDSKIYPLKTYNISDINKYFDELFYDDWSYSDESYEEELNNKL